MTRAPDRRAPATVAELLACRADDDGTGLVAGPQRWSWREVVVESGRYACSLHSMRRDGPFHVGVLLGNTPEHVFTLFGAAMVGAAVVGLNDTRRGEELARDVRHTDCFVVLTDERGAELLDGLDLGGAEVIRVDEPVWTDLLECAGGARRLAAPRPEDLFVLIFTSGSTGAPKAVRMTHARAARMANSATWFGSHDVLYCAMPLFHGNALNAIVLPAVASGAAIALRDRFSASQFMPDVRRYGATFFSTVGRALAYILATPEDPADTDHRVAFALAPESSPADVRAFRRRFGISCVTGYGSSENAIVMVPVPGMPKDALGIPQEGIDAAAVDPETGVERARARFDGDGRLLNPGEAIGEIVGRNVADRFEGYYRNPEADAARTRGGWYWSGDLGYRDDEGIFYFAGRTGERLRVDSENLAVAPIERLLSRFPGAAGVAVYAVPDVRTADDQVMAAIEPTRNCDFDPVEFGRFLASQRDLGAKWAPRFVRVATLPLLATNKVDKASLRAQGLDTHDPIYWRPGGELRYRRLTSAEAEAMRARAREHGRGGRTS